MSFLGTRGGLKLLFGIYFHQKMRFWPNIHASTAAGIKVLQKNGIQIRDQRHQVRKKQRSKQGQTFYCLRAYLHWGIGRLAEKLLNSKILTQELLRITQLF